MKFDLLFCVLSVEYFLLSRHFHIGHCTTLFCHRKFILHRHIWIYWKTLIFAKFFFSIFSVFVALDTNWLLEQQHSLLSFPCTTLNPLMKICSSQTHSITSPNIGRTTQSSSCIRLNYAFNQKYAEKFRVCNSMSISIHVSIYHMSIVGCPLGPIEKRFTCHIHHWVLFHVIESYYNHVIEHCINFHCLTCQLCASNWAWVSLHSMKLVETEFLERNANCKF